MNEIMFAHAFWGEKNAGFDVFNQNLKAGIKNTSDFYDFLREINSIEENYGKGLIKLSKQISSYSLIGSFKPCWLTTGTMIDKCVSLKNNLDSERISLMRDVQKYLDELQKKQRQLKESEAATQEVVHSFQVASTHLQKAKDLYHIRYKEYERVRLNETHSERDRQKTEAKLKKAQDDYKYSVEKYNNLRTQFVEKMRISCSHFQTAEFAHLEKMCEFLERYGMTWESTAHSVASLAGEFNLNRLELTPDFLLAGFVLERETGKQEPLPAAFEDVEVAAAFNKSLPQPSGESNCKSSLSQNPSIDMPCPDSEQIGYLRTVSAQATVGNPGDRGGGSPLERCTGRGGNNLMESGQSDSAWQLGETSSARTNRKPRTDFGGSLFSRRNRQNSCGLEATNSTARIADAGLTSGAIFTNGSSGGSSLVLRLANVRNRTRITRMSSNSPIATGDAKTGLGPSPIPPHQPLTDEEGYTLRPENPWDTPSGSDLANDSGSDISDSNERSEPTFTGIKVKIRPLGDLAPAVISASNQEIVLAAPQLPARRQLASVRATSITGQETGNSGSIKVKDFRSSTRPHTSTDKRFPQEVVPSLLPPPPPPPQPSSAYPNSLSNSLSSSLSWTMDTWSTRRPRPNVSIVPKTISDTLSRDNGIHKNASFDEKLMSIGGEQLCRNALAPLVHSQVEQSEGVEIEGTLNMTTNDYSEPLTILPNPAWKAFFPSPSNPEHVEEKGTADVYDRLINFDDEMTLSNGHLKSPEPTAIGPAPIANVDEENEYDTYEKVSSRVRKETDDEATTVAQSTPLPLSPHHSLTPKPTPIPPYIQALDPLSSRALPVPPHDSTAPLLPIAVAMTETWRIQFPNGGGSSFTTALANAELAPQSLTGQVTLAVPWKDLRHLRETDRVSQLAINPLVFAFDNTKRVRAIKTAFSGIQVKPVTSETFHVTIPGDLLYNCLVSSSAKDSRTKDYARLTVLDYSVDLKEGLRPPIIVCTYWRCEPTVTDFRLDYFINWPQWPSNSPYSVMNQQQSSNAGDIAVYDLRVMLSVDSHVTRVQSRPLCTWNSELSRANWRLPLSVHDNPPPNPIAHNNPASLTDKMTSGLIRAKFTLENGPGRPQTVGLQFCHDGGPLPSGVTISLRHPPSTTPVYHLNVCKYRLIGDRYLCDPPVSHSPK